MVAPRIATFAVDGSARYGAVTDRGIVDLSARWAKDFPSLREIIAAGALIRLAEDAARLPADHALDAAVAGAGVAFSYKLIASDDVHSGRLVCPFGPELPLESAYYFVCPKGHETRPNVRAFHDWLFAEMEETRARWAALTPR